jgi:hypothetical protein
MRHADSIARRGRAVAVTLIAATQKPTQKAMGQGALRSQMDVRISFRVRERKDTDLILGQGMYAAGWHAHALNAPGKFLISAPEHDTPRRGRAYLLTDQVVQEAAARYAPVRPGLDEVSLRALTTPTAPESAAEAGIAGGQPGGPGGPGGSGGTTAEPGGDGADMLLWAVLSLAPPQGLSVPDLITATGMSRRWVYYRLRDLAAEGRITQTQRGNWRAATPGGDPQ